MSLSVGYTEGPHQSHGLTNAVGNFPKSDPNSTSCVRSRSSDPSPPVKPRRTIRTTVDLTVALFRSVLFAWQYDAGCEITHAEAGIETPLCCDQATSRETVR